MYLPSFYKLAFEKYLFNVKRVGAFMVPVGMWGNSSFLYLVVWAFYPQIYNCIYTDFIPPARGVQRRIVEE
jgi:hypothetical protein